MSLPLRGGIIQGRIISFFWLWGIPLPATMQQRFFCHCLKKRPTGILQKSPITANMATWFSPEEKTDRKECFPLQPGRAGLISAEIKLIRCIDYMIEIIEGLFF